MVCCVCVDGNGAGTLVGGTSRDPVRLLSFSLLGGPEKPSSMQSRMLRPPAVCSGVSRPPAPCSFSAPGCRAFLVGEDTLAT